MITLEGKINYVFSSSYATPYEEFLPEYELGFLDEMKPIEARKMMNASQDRIVERVRSKLLERSQVGIQKYGCTLEREDLDVFAWVDHLQCELMDGAVYLERLKQELEALIK